MATVKNIYQYLDSIAPFALQMDFDNSGFLVGRGDRQVNRILVALDITQTVIDEAKQKNCQLIVSHHPVIFTPAKSVTDGDLNGQLLLDLVENGISAICAHTNLDAVAGGVNDCLAQTLALTQIEQLHQDGVDRSGAPYGIGRVGLAHTQGIGAAEYAEYVKEKLGTSSVRYADGGKPVSKVAVGGGSCGSMLLDALDAGCDTFVTSDVKYNQYLEARAMGITLMDAGHYATENVVCAPLADRLSRAFPEIEVLLSYEHQEVYGNV